eukprot:scaffold102057_cov22-Tisochrysis_lutea.AAC.1
MLANACLRDMHVGGEGAGGQRFNKVARGPFADKSFNMHAHLQDNDDGEEMSVDGNGGQGGNEDGEEAEGFVVEDGFLSEDEGAREMDEGEAYEQEH